jgi:hypothetical protein
MSTQVSWFSCLHAPTAARRYRIPRLAVLLTLAAVVLPSLQAQIANRITEAVDRSNVQALPNHHPLWANTANSIGLAPADLQLNQFTMVLARSTQQQAAFDQFVVDQQNPASPEFHHWLTPEEVGARFGLSDQDIATVTDWLQSQGLHVNWIAPSRVFIGFGGTAANVGSAFGAEMRYYMVNGAKRLSIDSDPQIPAAIAPAINGVRGLYTIDEHPNHRASTLSSPTPELTTSGGAHFLTPADFNQIYDVPSNLTGAGVTIGIVSWARVNTADLDNFRNKTGATFANPTVVIPTAYGGIDPGAALTAPPTGSTSTGAQEEATLDVIRAGSIAPGASLLLVASSSAATNDGIGEDAQYIVGTSPVPAQVMTISFGACESSAGASNVNFWDNIFQTAAAEGISVFVSSGDSGAAGCDTAFSTPPALPRANSPNYICSSSYATCVGGTQFNDTANPSTYWTTTNGTGYLSAIGYIPEGAWNESTSTSVAGTGGGVSTVIATPSWQTGTGVPSARTGRYTPDISFSAAGHDGYFACMAADNGSCVTSSGTFGFVAFEGTSASAPGMAGVAALLNQKLGGAQGNLNPLLYPLASSAPTAFHDTTPASSGVGSCSLTTASICNNSVASTSGNAQAGFALQTGYDEATGLGSLDVTVFLNSYNSASTKTTPTITWAAPAAITYGTALSTTQLNATASVAGTFVYSPAAGTILTAGAQTLSVTFTPTDTTTYNNATATVSLTVNKITPTITWATPAAITYGTALSSAQLNATASVAGTFAYSPAAGSILTVGAKTLSVAFTPTDTTDYNSTTATVSLTVHQAVPVITWATPSAMAAGTALSTTQLNATSAVAGTFVYTPALGTVISATGTTTLSTIFTPTDSIDYAPATAAVSLSVVPGFTISGTAVTVAAGATTNNTSTITVTPTAAFTGSVTLAASVSNSTGTQYPPTVSFGSTSPVSLTSAAVPATLTISTTASKTTTCTAANQAPNGIPWYATGGAVLASMFLFGIAPKRRKWQAMVGILVLLAALASGMTACGGGSASTSCTPTTTAGTTAGAYTITITGTGPSGTPTATNTITLTVQ